MPNTKNAHVRTDTSKRRAPESLAEESKRLLDDPAFIRGYDTVHNGLVNALANIQHDGSESMDNYERELCRTLRTLHSLRRSIALGVQGQQLRLAEFKPVNPEDE